MQDADKGMVERWRPAVGDRVVLKQSQSWLQPYRRFSEEARPATVTRAGALQIRIEFDVKRKGAAPQHGFFYAKDLLPA